MSLFFVKGGFMNTNRLYKVDVYRIIESKIENNTMEVNGMFSRETIVYDTGYGDYYDLITDKTLSAGLQFSFVGNEYIRSTSFVPYNEYLNNQKQNLSKRKIKKLYKKHKNIGNNN